jgi:hypothetical protein
MYWICVLKNPSPLPVACRPTPLTFDFILASRLLPQQHILQDPYQPHCPPSFEHRHKSRTALDIPFDKASTDLDFDIQDSVNISKLMPGGIVMYLWVERHSFSFGGVLAYTSNNTVCLYGLCAEP